MLDTDNDGQLNGEDLKRGVSLFGNILQFGKKKLTPQYTDLFEYIGNSVTESDIEEMMASADVDGDGLINYEEFLKVMVSSTLCSVRWINLIVFCVDTLQS